MHWLKLINQIEIDWSWRRVVLGLIHHLLNIGEGKSLADGVPIIHLVILAGCRYDLTDHTEDLFRDFLEKRPPEERQSVCPYSGESAVDVAVRCSSEDGFCGLHVARQLYRLGVRPVTQNILFWARLQAQRTSLKGAIEPHLPEIRPDIDPFDAARQVSGEIRRLLHNEEDFNNSVRGAFVSCWTPGKCKADMSG